MDQSGARCKRALATPSLITNSGLMHSFTFMSLNKTRGNTLVMFLVCRDGVRFS